MALPRLQWPLAFDKREPEIDPPGVIPGWLVRMADLTSWILIAALMYFLWLWTLEISGDRATPLLISKVGTLELNTAFYWPLLVGFMGSAIGLPLLAKIGIPIFCELSFKKPGQGWPKFWMLVLIIMTSVVIIAGNMHVINGARLEKNREGAVRMEANDQARAALQANLDSINADLKDITNPALTTYQAQASREGAAAWAKRLERARAIRDPQADMIDKAMAAAERGDQLRADRAKAIQALAAAPTQAAAAERIVKQGDWVTTMVDEIDRVRAVLLGSVQDLAALLLGWIAYRLAAVRKQQLADWEAVHAAPVPEAGIDTLAIEDQTDQWQVQPQDIQYDEYGNELVKVRRRKEEYYRRKSPSKKKQKDDPRAAQMFDGLSEGGQNPQSEVSDGTSNVDRSEGDIRGIPDTVLPVFGGAAGDALFEGAEEIVDDRLEAGDSATQGGTLTHAEEDQQADEPVDDEAAFSVDSSDAEIDVAEVGIEGDVERAGGSDQDEVATDERAAEDLTQTLLPDGEGVLVGTPIIPDDEAEALNEQLMARRAAAEAAE